MALHFANDSGEDIQTFFSNCMKSALQTEDKVVKEVFLHPVTFIILLSKSGFFIDSPYVLDVIL